MVDRGATPASGALPDDWPARPERCLALNHVGTFDWDLLSGRLHLDPIALDILGVPPGEFHGSVTDLAARVPRADGARLDALVSRALKDGSESYGAYHRVRCPDGLRWAYTQGRIERDAAGRPRRILGILREANEELRLPDRPGEQNGDRRHTTTVVETTTAALAHARTVQDVIDFFKDARAVEHLGSDLLVLGLVESGRVHLVAEGPSEHFIPGTRYTRIDDDFPMSEVIRTMTPRFIESREEWARCYPWLWERIKGIGISSAAYLPLIAQARPIGALGLLYREARGFTRQERDLFIALSSSLAQSIARAMLFDQEHDLAEGLQQAMLPRRIPEVPGAQIAVRYRSARMGRDIGGDWYDVVPLPGGRVAAVIGDVQGHDTHASAVMGQLRIVLRAYAAEGHSPGTVMARASAFLHELDTDRFATCSYAEADLATGSVQLVRAGHIDPLLRHADGTSRRLPVAGGLPLGLSAEFGRLDYPVTTVEIEPGETLMMFTDGLVEQPGSDLDEGIRLLAGLVQEGPDDLHDLADRLCDVVEERVGEDDMAILLLRRQGTVARPGGRLQQHIAPADPEALSAARHMIRTAVRAWGVRDRADDIELAADELATNALLHTDGAAVVTIRMLPGAGRRLRVEVEDRSSALPRRREPGESGVSGRGLLLVDRLADVWGVESRGSGKSVWCEFDLGPASGEGSGTPERRSP
ncbi:MULTISPECIES: SpoIIE family protein phosphatase [Streptomyces]|uniref:SpoIIE family protein phosphatase n=1 Tax=Streptomyces TaxID=1883 RepID=UPI00163C523B|nr:MULTISPECIES: SpoIIE family protein phosphatase [Streptomyces]MBC2874154.1 serine/threonine-protein phosphatase [Streptomyces sp. TYQ1024]UBI40204.1 SpoIIE family protein phosphatase [Streptomyces mobaraensis]UKW32782.1 SpoIIE family protein phosphatase [Streptomyces sp. TYQ1024]